MKKIAIRLSALVLAACLFTGCSIANTAGGESEADRKNAGGEAVSGSVAAEDDGGLDVRNQDCRENSNCHYTIVEDKEGNSYIAQSDLAGKQIKKIRFDIDGIEWVTDEWIYYTTVRDEDILWRMPVKKTERGEKLLTERKEKVLEECIEVYYATDLYVITDVWINGNWVLCKYNCKTEKRTELVKVKEEDDQAEVLWSVWYPLMWQGKLFFERRDKLCLLDPEDGEVSPLHTFDSSEGDWREQYILEDYGLKGDELYYKTENDNVYRLNCSTKKSECVLGRAEFREEVRRLPYGDIEDICFDLMWLDQDRIYFSFTIEWTERDKTTGKKAVCRKEELFSAALNDQTQLRHEDKLMDYLDKKGKRKVTDVLEYRYLGEILGGWDGVIAAIYHPKENTSEKRYAIYDIRTKEIMDVEEKEILGKKYEDIFFG